MREREPCSSGIPEGRQIQMIETMQIDNSVASFGPNASMWHPARPSTMVEASDDYQLASRVSRFTARVIDSSLLLLVLFPGLCVAAMGTGKNLVSIIGFALVGAGVIGLLTYQWWSLVTTGQSIGKRRMDIRVTRLDGKKLSFVQVIVYREWLVDPVRWIPVVGNLFSLIDRLMIFGKTRRCLHDRIAGTRVVSARH